MSEGEQGWTDGYNMKEEEEKELINIPNMDLGNAMTSRIEGD
jgi:hypothetical protein